MPWAFEDRKTAEDLKEIARTRPWDRPKQYIAGDPIGKGTPQIPYTKGWIFKTPPEGIPARNGLAISKADCTPYVQIEASPTSMNLEEILDETGASQTMEVWHLFGPEDVPGDAFVACIECHGLLCVIAGDCV